MASPPPRSKTGRTSTIGRKSAKKASKKTAKKAARKISKAAPKKAARKISKAAPKKASRKTARKRATPKKATVADLLPRRTAPRELQLIESPALMQAASMAFRRSLSTIGFVPTMGALHDAHLQLLREARRRCDVLVVSVFVNPLQFNRSKDLEHYPRSLSADRLKCKAAGVDILFAPSTEAIYPAGADTTVHVQDLSARLCGASRPGHFDGVCTVVSKLFNLVRPHFAVFGEKDFQQQQIVRRMVRDLSIPVEVLCLPVMRELDGLAISSRNQRLDPALRDQATGLYRAIEAAQRGAERGERRASRLIAAARTELAKRPQLREDYVEIVDPDSLHPVDLVARHARILIAAHLGDVRLIDNGPLIAA